MATFLLLHGGFHGSWCWEQVRHDLKNFGHDSLAPELPCDDPAAGLDAYVDTALAATDTASASEIVLVGHSLGARIAVLAAARLQFRSLVLLGHVPGPVADAAESASTMAAFLTTRIFQHDSGLILLEPGEFRRMFYGCCKDTEADFALARLRPQGVKPLVEPWPLDRWPSTPIHVILGRHDVVTPLEEATTAASRLPDSREPVVLDSDHSPFICCPQILAETIVSAAATR